MRERIDDLYGRLRGDADVEALGGTAVILHLGVDYRGTKFRLERCAYDDATFRVPDERGYRPEGVCILGEDVDGESSRGLGRCLKTTLDLDRLCRELKKCKGSPDVFVSDDPGRFVCNYAYCLSLDRCRSFGEQHEIRKGDPSNECCDALKSDDSNQAITNGDAQSACLKPLECHALFVHVPPFHVVAEDRQLDFILKIMQTIEQQLTTSTS